MTEIAVRKRGGRIGLVVRSLLALAAFALLIGLGTWQLQRKTWKEGLIATLNARVTAAPADLPARTEWKSLDQGRQEFRRVAFSAEFLPGEEALVYTNGSAFRSDVKEPGYWVMAPAKLAGGSVVVVNRGFVPEASKAPATRSAGNLSGMVDLVGAVRWPEERGMFTPADSPATGIYFTRDPQAIAAAKHWGVVAPFYVELESPVPPGGLPRPAPITVNLRNEHLQYAITWYGLAAALAGVFLAWLFGRRSRAG